MIIPIEIRRKDGTTHTHLVTHLVTNEETPRRYIKMLWDFEQAAEKDPYRAVQVYGGALKQLEGR